MRYNLYTDGSNRILITKDNTFSHVSCLEWGINFRRETTRAKSEFKELDLIVNLKEVYFEKK